MMSDDFSQDEVLGYDEDKNPITRRLLHNMIRCGYTSTAQYFLGMYCPGFTLDDV